ncbi:MAG: M48 family metallopeptidase [Owenweeksia sp.]
MKKYFFIASLFLIGSCKTVPLTGRKQLNLIPSDQVQSLSNDQYRQVISGSQLSSNAEWSNWVSTVGNDIKNGVEEYLRQERHLELIEDYRWEFNLIKEDQTVNAWAMPGGKVAFYTGILPICETKQGVAVVMGHEVAHAIARHGNERMSQGLVQQLGGVALAVALKDKPAETQALFMGAYGVASQVGVLLPFSRTHESEADHLGLIFMAMAGYDPREAPKFWQRMEARSGGGQPPEFLSTHPSHTTRINNLNKWMPEALKYYQPAAN